MYSQQEPESIKEMFSTIASDYDRANQIMSFGFCKRWNNALVKEMMRHDPKTLLDLCAGTGDIAFRFLEQCNTAQAFLLDFCPEMLQVALQKGKPFSNRFTTLVADAQSLPFEKESVDAISIAYGIRNVRNTFLCFSESYRVLQAKGVLAILELTRPTSPFLHLPHQLYLSTLLPLIGKCCASNKKAYQYLSKSIHNFSTPRLLEEMLKKIGFSKVTKKPLMGGVATILLAVK